MGLLSKNFEKRAVDLLDADKLAELGWIQRSASGIHVDQSNALTYSAVYACVRVLAESVASLPLITYKRRPDWGKDRAVSFYLYSLLHDQPNPYTTSFEYREMMMMHLATWGNHYAELQINNRGRIEAIWPLNPAKVEKIERRDDGLIYHYRMPDYRVVELPGWKIWHVRGMGDGLMGLSPVGLHRQTIGLGLAAEKFGAKFFGNGAQLGGVFTHPGVLSEPAYERLKGSISNEWGGLDNVARTAILEEGMSYERVGIPPEDAQFLETRKFQVNEIARIYRVPPHMIGDLDRATFSNVEQQSIDFVVHTIRPWLVRLEQSIQAQLMTANERSRYFVEFLVDGLLRGDTASRYQAYATGRQNGWLSANDIRRLENQNPIEGGDIYLVPLNMVDASGVGALNELSLEEPQGERGQTEPAAKMEARERKPQAAAERHKLEGVYRPLFADVLGRIVRREANDIGNAAARIFGKRNAEAFREWLIEFYIEHREFVEKQLTPTEEAYAKQVIALAALELEQEAPDLVNFVQSYISDAAARMTARNEARLLAVLDKALADGVDPLPEIESTLSDWRETRAETMAQDESVRANNAFAVAAYGAMGVLYKLWVTFGENCPYCDSLAGRAVGIDTPFIAAGQSLNPDGANGPLSPSGNIGHPPAHRGCDCMVVAG